MIVKDLTLILAYKLMHLQTIGAVVQIRYICFSKTLTP